jgi:hypothetical protein
MHAETQFRWLRELVIPAIFTLFGAALGFLTSQINDWFKAKRDKKAFLRAIGMELDTLSVQLDEWGRAVKDSLESLNGGALNGPQYSAGLQTLVFSSQLSKLRDVDDPLLAEVILFYSELGALEPSIKIVNDTSSEFTRAEASDWLEPKHGTKDPIRPRLLSSLSLLQRKISTTSEKLRKLRAKLPV